MEEREGQMQTQVEQPTTGGTGMMVVSVLLLAIAGVVATVLLMLRG
jgi:hypothetical protein